MIKNLKHKSKKEAQLILAGMSGMFLLSPESSNSDSSSSPNKKLWDEILDEIKYKLKIKNEDYSAITKAKIYGFIANEMAQLALPDKEISETKKRVGQRGVLQPNLYSVIFLDSFNQIEKTYSLKKADVISAINSPDYYDHLFPNDLDLDSISLYAKSMEFKKERFYLLVVAKRIGATQNVYSVWRAFQSDLNISTIDSALDILKKLVDVYGLKLEIGDKSGKLLINEVVTTTQAISGMCDVKIHVHRPRDIEAQTNAIGHTYKGRPGSLVRIAFSLNVTKYKNDLRQHGIIN